MVEPLSAPKVSKAYWRAEKKAIAYEIDDDSTNCNFIGTTGFLVALMIAMSIIPGGGFLAAPVCSTWVWINRGTSKRSSWDPLGDKRG